MSEVVMILEQGTGGGNNGGPAHDMPPAVGRSQRRQHALRQDRADHARGHNEPRSGGAVPRAGSVT